MAFLGKSGQAGMPAPRLSAADRCPKWGRHPCLPLFAQMVAALLAAALGATAFAAQSPSPLPLVPSKTSGVIPTTLPSGLRDVGIDQKLNAQMPLSLLFTDEEGRRVQLKDYFGKRPVILSFVYYDCPMLCSMVLNGLVRGLRPVGLNPGRDFEIVTVSFDPRETAPLAAAKKRVYLNSYRRPSAEQGWHFLTGDEPSIRTLTRAAGFNYHWDEASQQYAHASGIMVLTPDGRMSRYFYGIEFSGRDLRLGLIDASSGRIGTVADQVLLYCFHYDPAAGKYGVAIMNVMRLAGLTTLLLVGGFIGANIWHERRTPA
jgi:protein SCO1